MVRLSDESQKMTMDTLRYIHGSNFQLDNQTKYRDRGTRMKKSYWEDRGTLIVQGVTNYSATNTISEPEDRLRRFAITKLENYGFATTHCVEALDNCDWDTDEALYLLFRKYMKIPDEQKLAESYPPEGITKNELIEIREDEKSALESIYDKSFEEKERYQVWNLKFKLDFLLIYSPSEKKRLKNEQQLKIQDEKPSINNNSKKEKCRNFSKDGKCKFGLKCRFSHVISENRNANIDHSKKKQDDDEIWFILEIRFSPDTKYPYEAPFIYLKTTCHDIPNEILLKISRKLYHEAKNITSEGMPCVYSISEILQMEETLLQAITDENQHFLDADKSLFYVELNENSLENGIFNETLPSHYEIGQTSRSDLPRKSQHQIEQEDKQLVRRFIQKQNDLEYKKMLVGRRKLPAFLKMMEV